MGSPVDPITRVEGRPLPEAPAVGPTTTSPTAADWSEIYQTSPFAQRPLQKPVASEVAAAEAYARAFASGVELAVKAAEADGYADFVDTFGFTGRMRAGDARAMARILTGAVHAVVEEIRSGRRTLQPNQIVDAAKALIQHGAVVDAGETGSLGSRSVQSLLLPNTSALAALASPLGQTVARGASRVAAAAPEDRGHAQVEADLSTAYALYQGKSTPSMAGAPSRHRRVSHP